jgi:2-methylisocitrate lyase-like PEP mutase family enzyme
MTAAERAESFKRLHGGPLLVLPNAWDAASAAVFAQAGFPAVATSSGAIAFAAGVPDGERLPRDQMLTALERVCAAVDIPVSADLEAGYGESADEVAETVRLAVEAGAVGVNLEVASGRLEHLPSARLPNRSSGCSPPGKPPRGPACRCS